MENLSNRVKVRGDKLWIFTPTLPFPPREGEGRNGVHFQHSSLSAQPSGPGLVGKGNEPITTYHIERGQNNEKVARNYFNCFYFNLLYGFE